MSTEFESVDPVGDEVVINLARAALFAALMGAFAYVSFPNPLAPGIPVTLQVLGVFLAGIMLGPLWGGFALLVYLIAGAVGIPVFSGGSAGLGALLGPTGGYLLSYPFAAAATGLVVHGGPNLTRYKDASTVSLVGGMVLGTVLIYAGGVAGLMYFGGYGLAGAVSAGVVAFVPVEAVKILAAIGIVRSDAIAAA
jgi:biotin transport system substrate-specific component